MSIAQLPSRHLIIVGAIIALALLSSVTASLPAEQAPALFFRHQVAPVEGGTVEDVAVVGGYAYLAQGPAGLRILDLSSSPPGYLSYAGATPLRSVTAHQGHLYAVAASGDLVVYALTDPTAPEDVGSLALGLTGKLAVAGNLAFGATETQLRVLDLADPADPQAVGGLDLPGIQALAAEGTTVYLATCCASGESGRAVAVSAANPQSPQILDSLVFPTGDVSYGQSTIGLGPGVIYVAGGGCADLCVGGLHIISRANPQDLAEVGLHNMSVRRETRAFSPPRSLTADGALVFLALDVCRFTCTHTGVEVVNAQTAGAPRSRSYTAYPRSVRGSGFDEVGDGARQPLLVGAQLYIPFGSRGLVIFERGYFRTTLPLLAG